MNPERQNKVEANPSPFKIPILTYHKVDVRREFGITNVSPKTFEKQIKYLKSEGYVSITPELLIERLLGKVQIPDKSLLITFDDGYESIYQYAYPLLVEDKFVATIFLLAGYVNRWNVWDSGSIGRRFRHLRWDQIIDMYKSGFSFGAHGMNHKFLCSAKESEAVYEITASKAQIEDKLGCQTRFFSYPYGNYDQRTKALVKSAGYEAAFCLKPHLEIRLENLYSLPRTCIYLVDSFTDFKSKLDFANEARFKFQTYKNLFINRCSYASLLMR